VRTHAREAHGPAAAAARRLAQDPEAAQDAQMRIRTHEIMASAI
jgi:hypothetical protein